MCERKKDQALHFTILPTLRREREREREREKITPIPGTGQYSHGLAPDQELWESG